jgi:hypothetical protein
MKLSQILFHPFHRIAGGTALLLGLAAITLTGLIGAGQGLHFDGVLDTHAGKSGPWWLFVTEGFIDWISLAVLLLIAGRIISKTAFRSIDLVGTQAFARWPTMLVALACLTPGFHRFSDALTKSIIGLKPGQVPELPAAGPDAVVFALVTLFMLTCSVWMVALMWKSFSHCCNLRGGKAVGTFVIVLLLAELLSKVLIGQLFQLL